MVASLIAVVAMILGLAWMTRRMQGLRGVNDSGLRVRGSLSVGLKERVVIVEAAGQQFLIGVAPGNVRLLQPLGAAVESESLAPAGTAPNEGHQHGGQGGGMPLSQAFAVQLNKLLGK